MAREALRELAAQAHAAGESALHLRDCCTGARRRAAAAREAGAARGCGRGRPGRTSAGGCWKVLAAPGVRWMVTPAGSRKFAMSVESVFPQLEALLPHVQKPIQYVGGELNSTVKPWDACDVRWALMYPDAYEVGLPNQGVMILYEVLNEREGVLAERTYSVWPDLEELMREHGVPQFTVDSHRPVEGVRRLRR